MLDEWIINNILYYSRLLFFNTAVVLKNNGFRCCSMTSEPIAPIFSLTTVAITNSIFTFSQLPAGTCCFLGNRTGCRNLLCHGMRLMQHSTLKVRRGCCHKRWPRWFYFFDLEIIIIFFFLTRVNFLPRDCPWQNERGWCDLGNDGWRTSRHFPREMRHRNVWR